MARTDMRAIVSLLKGADGGVVERCLGYIGVDWGEGNMVKLSIFSDDLSKPLAPARFVYPATSPLLVGLNYSFAIGDTRGGKLRCFKAVPEGWQLDVYIDGGKLDFSTLLVVSPHMRTFLESLETAYRSKK